MRRAYGQYCGLARALDVVGERWTLLIVRELIPGPKRYSDLIANLQGIGTSLLAERLKHLEREGIIVRGTLPPPAASAVYTLTDEGRDLSEAMIPLVAWGVKRLGTPAPDEMIRLRWVIDFMQATCRPEASAGVQATFEFRLPHGTISARVDDGEVVFTEEASPSPPDFAMECSLETLSAIGAGTLNTAEEIAAGRLKISGTPEAIGWARAIFGRATSARAAQTDAAPVG